MKKKAKAKSSGSSKKFTWDKGDVQIMSAKEWAKKKKK